MWTPRLWYKVFPFVLTDLDIPAMIMTIIQSYILFSWFLKVYLILCREHQDKQIEHTDAAPPQDTDHQPVPSNDHDYVTDPNPLTDREAGTLETVYRHIGS